MEQKEPQLYLEADFIREEDEDDGIPEDPESLQQQLRKFREQWQQELLDQRDSPEESVWSEQKFKKHNRTVNDGKKTGLQEEKAKDLYVKGVQAEQKGYLYDAVRFYRQAIQLVPDIEYKINFIPIRIPRERQASETSVGSSQSVEEFDEEEDLLTHFQKLQCKESAICKPEVEQRVSRGFYLCSADEELWRLICVRIWGTNCISCRKYGSWRNMYSQRPHLKYNGCYISKCSYVRQGEKGLDYFYKPWHLVEYYRYLRFFPDGGVVMLSSPEEPTACIPKLKNNSPKYQGMLSGYYRISGNTVTAIMTYVKASSDPQTQYYRYRLNRNNQDNENDREQTFHMEFSLEAAGKRKFSKLCWSNYFLRTYCRATGNDSVTAFELNSKNYPALIFSQVAPLQVGQKETSPSCMSPEPPFHVVRDLRTMLIAQNHYLQTKIQKQQNKTSEEALASVQESSSGDSPHKSWQRTSLELNTPHNSAQNSQPFCNIPHLWQSQQSQ